MSRSRHETELSPPGFGAKRVVQCHLRACLGSTLEKGTRTQSQIACTSQAEAAIAACRRALVAGLRTHYSKRTACSASRCSALVRTVVLRDVRGAGRGGSPRLRDGGGDDRHRRSHGVACCRRPFIDSNVDGRGDGWWVG